MANVLVDEASLQGIADSIRAKNGTETTYKPSEMAQAISEIETGGGDSWYDTFWDAYQQNGERTDYRSAFTGTLNWTEEIFWPKHDIITYGGSHYMFQNSGIEVDLEQRIIDCGITFNLTSPGNRMYEGSAFTVVPAIPGGTSATPNVFSKCTKLHTIRKIISEATATYSGWFGGCTALENIVFEGEIGTAISFSSSSLLSDASIQSIIDHLVDLTGSTAKTLTLHSDVKAKLTDTQIATITSKNWTLA